MAGAAREGRAGCVSAAEGDLFQCWDLLLTVTIGFLLDPELMFPDVCGAFVNGLFSHLGPYSGNMGVRDSSCRHIPQPSPLPPPRYPSLSSAVRAFSAQPAIV